MRLVGCNTCKMEVINDEIALNIKLFGKQIGRIFCYQCLSEKLECEKSDLLERSNYFKRTGCIIFKTQFTERENRNGESNNSLPQKN